MSSKAQQALLTAPAQAPRRTSRVNWADGPNAAQPRRQKRALAQKSNPNRHQAHNPSRRLQTKGPNFIDAAAPISQQRASHRIAKLRKSQFLAALLPPKSSTHRSANRHHFTEYEIRARLVPQWPPKPVICKAVGFLPRHAVLPLKTLDLHCHRSTIPLNPIKLIGFAM